MRMNSTQLFDELLKDNERPVIPDQGQHMAELMESKLSSMMEKFDKKLDEKINSFQPKVFQSEQPEVISEDDNILPEEAAEEEGGENE